MNEHPHHHHGHTGCTHHHEDAGPAPLPPQTRKARLVLLVICLGVVAGVVVFFPVWKDAVATALLWIQAQQKLFHETMGRDLRAVAETHALGATLSLVSVGFLYGIFHAVGPGHGKVIVTGYLLAGRHTLRRGIMVSALSSLLQAITAIVVVVGLYQILGLARQETEKAAAWLEVAGYGFMALVGLALLVRGLREAWHLKEQHHHHEGCNHGMDPAAVAATSDRRSLVLMILSIGIRPCTGAIILLVFACMMGAVWAGILATLAMGVGTFITTATLAVLALQSKTGLLRVFGASETFLRVIHALLGVGAGLFIVVVASLFLAASWPQDDPDLGPPQHPLLNRK
jgi:ABC-type nickel/cobalt efflux system permease component RcnA